MFLFGLVIGGDIGAIGFGFIGLVFGGVVWAGGSEDD